MRHSTLTGLISGALLASGCTINIVPARHAPEGSESSSKPVAPGQRQSRNLHMKAQ